jgi:hypothetical protein
MFNKKIRFSSDAVSVYSSRISTVMLSL